MGRIRRKIKVIAPLLVAMALLVLVAGYMHRHTIAVLQPAGVIGQKERQLIIIGVLLSVIVVVPVYIMTIMIALKYRESNTRAKYDPGWDHSPLFESIWWGIPLAIITILSIITWNSSHALDPYRSLTSSKKSITIQVIALNWKWLFVYPDQHVASVNQVKLPVNTPVDFQITSDTVMNSFWVPQLGSQIYAMPGMSTELHLIANKPGNYYGSSANISGVGFAGMHFMARAMPQADFDNWVHAAQNAPTKLTMSAYNNLAHPSQNNPIAYYAAAQPGLYNDIVMKYMAPAGSHHIVMPGMAE